MSLINKNKKKKPKNILNDLTGKEWIQLTKSWFILKVKPRSKDEVRHPGKFPSELVNRYLRFFTKKEQWVIDPFLGTGSTLLACRELYRNGVGIEINPVFVDLANKSLEQKTLFSNTSQTVLLGDSLNINTILNDHFKGNSPKFNLCITSPPYWNMLSKHRGGSDSQHRDRKKKGLPLIYSEKNENDIGNVANYEGYLDKVIRVFVNLKSYMENNSYLIVVLQNIRDEKGNFVPIAWNFYEKMKKIFSPRQEQIWCQTDKRLGIWGYPKTYVSNVHHHYCLIFQNS